MSATNTRPSVRPHSPHWWPSELLYYPTVTFFASCFLEISAAGMDEQPIGAFITRWCKWGGAERANHQLFRHELCDVLQVPQPEPTVEDGSRNAYVFERSVLFDNWTGPTPRGALTCTNAVALCWNRNRVSSRRRKRLVPSAKQQERRAKRKRGHGTRHRRLGRRHVPRSRSSRAIRGMA